MGDAHPNILPYEVMAGRDGHFILTIGNDNQFQKFCAIFGLKDITAFKRETFLPGSKHQLCRKARSTPSAKTSPILMQSLVAYAWISKTVTATDCLRCARR